MKTHQLLTFLTAGFFCTSAHADSIYIAEPLELTLYTSEYNEDLCTNGSDDDGDGLTDFDDKDCKAFKKAAKKAKWKAKRDTILEISGYSTWKEFKAAPKAERKAARKAYREMIKEQEENPTPIEIFPPFIPPPATYLDLDGDGIEDDFIIPQAYIYDTNGDGIYDSYIEGRSPNNSYEEELAAQSDLDRDGRADDFFIECMLYVDSDSDGIYDTLAPLTSDIDGDCIEDDFIMEGEYLDTDGDGTYDTVVPYEYSFDIVE